MSELTQLSVGSIVEHKDSEAALTVKMVNGDQVVVQSEVGDLGVYKIDQLYVVPGDDYCRLRRVVVDTLSRVSGYTGNLASPRGALAVARELYGADVRRGQDVVEYLQSQMSVAITGCLTSTQVQDIIRQNAEYMAKREPLPITVVNPTKIPLMKPEGWEPAAVESSDEPKVLQHTDITGHSETLVQQLTDDELAMMCCEIADMLANGMGFTADMSHRKATKREQDMTLLQRRVTYWAEPRGNVRKSQVWEMAKKVVGHCRMAEVEDAVENVLEAIRQQEDSEDDL